MGPLMGRLKRLNNFRTCCTFSAALVIGLAFLLSVSATYSTQNEDGVYLELTTYSSWDNWTVSEGNDIFNFFVNNTNITLSLNEINVSVPVDGTGNALFIVDVSTLRITNTTWNDLPWNCTNATVDGLDNTTVVRCNTTSADALTNGSKLVVSFNATAPVTAGEDVYQWNVTVLNETNSYVVSQNISSGVDGQAPRISHFGANGTYFASLDNIKVWVNVTDASLNHTGVCLSIVNASNLSQTPGPPGPPITMNCDTYLGNYSWNCSFNIPISDDPPPIDVNATFNVSASDTVSHSNEGSFFPKWFFIDVTAPSVTLNYPVNGSWDDDGDVEFNFTPYDSSLSLANCSVWVANSTGGEWSLNDTNDAPVNNQMNNITVYGFSTDSDQQVQYIWNVRCWDQVANSSFASQNFTLNVGNRSNIIVESISFDDSEAPYVGMNIIANVTIANDGTANVTNSTSIHICFGKSSKPCSDNNILKNTTAVPAAELTYSDSHAIQYKLPVNMSDGVYYLYAYADYSGDGAEAEQYENDNTNSSSFSTSLNVTINSITSPSTLYAAQNVTVNVTVLYGNGTAVTGLQLGNFTVFDTWDSKSQLDDSEVGRDEDAEVAGRTAGHAGFEQGSGVYLFNYTVPGYNTYTVGVDDNVWYYSKYAEFGSHNISLDVAENMTGNYRSCTDCDAGTYSITAPFLEITHTNIDELEVSEEKSEGFYFSNAGNADIVVDIDIDADDPDDEIVTFDDWDPEWDSSSTGTLYGLDAGDTNDTYEGVMTGVAEGTGNITVLGEYTYDGQYLFYERIIEIEVNTPSDEDDDGDGGQTPAAAGLECVTNSSCDSDEWCNDDYECEEIECPEGYYATGHTCELVPVFEIDISGYEPEVTMLQGETVETELTVNNTGNEGLTVSLTVEMELENVSFNVTPASQAIAAGEEGNFTIMFNTSEDAKVGKHTLKYKATTTSVAGDTQVFTLVIRPLPETIEEIKLSYQNLTALVEQLLADFSAGKGALTGDNLTAMETKINSTETLFNSLKEAMEDEDYAQAATYLDELNTLIASSRSLMEELGISGTSSAFWNAVMIWVVVIVVCVGAVGLLIYMMVPARGYALGKGYAPQGGDITDRLKGMLKTIKEKTSTGKPSSAGQIVKNYKPAYSSGYSKLGGGYKPPARSMGEKMKNVLKKEK
jgi:hypothetical protein